MNGPLFGSLAAACAAVVVARSQDFSRDKFRQLDEWLPTATEARAASGAPGHRYWQQRADYEIDVVLDDERQRLAGSENDRLSQQFPRRPALSLDAVGRQFDGPERGPRRGPAGAEFRRFALRRSRALVGRGGVRRVVSNSKGARRRRGAARAYGGENHDADRLAQALAAGREDVFFSGMGFPRQRRDRVSRAHRIRAFRRGRQPPL